MGWLIGEGPAGPGGGRPATNIAPGVGYPSARVDGVLGPLHTRGAARIRRALLVVATILLAGAVTYGAEDPIGAAARGAERQIVARESEAPIGAAPHDAEQQMVAHDVEAPIRVVTHDVEAPIRVVTHDAVTVVTDPATGARSYPRWGVFPAETDIRKATVRVTFGCPDTMRCADWDYLDRIVIRRQGGAAAPALDFEIGRMITPYGGAFPPDWDFTWTSDVTDFVSLLRDSVEVDYVHTGYEPNEDRGWKITVAFELEPGPPIARPLSLERIHDGSYAYGDSARPIEAALHPSTFRAVDGAAFVRLVVFQTGHGMDSNGCGEFCSKMRTIRFDGEAADRRPLWKRCGENPLSPQAGTWIFDRAGWCPGDLVAPETFDFPVRAGETHTVGLEMEPYSSPEASAVEAITAYLVQYGPPTAKHDVELLSIDVPSRDDMNRRNNPACSGARILVRNNGSAPVRSLTIRYGTEGFVDRVHRWTEEILFGAVQMIPLPGDIPAGPGPNRFRVEIEGEVGPGSEPENGSPGGRADGPEGGPEHRPDAWPADNARVVAFDPVPALAYPVVLELRTNAEPAHTAYLLRDGEGRTVYEVLTGELPADSMVVDTFRLAPGCYTFALVDAAGDGLEFWYNVAGGRGYARLRDGRGGIVKSFESDFGSSIRYSFRVTSLPSAWTPLESRPAVGLFPTRTLGVTTLDYEANEPQTVTVTIVTDPGDDVVETYTYPELRSGRFTYDLTARGPQRYYLRVEAGGELVFNKRIRVVESLE